MIVMKFGGSSVADAERIKRVAEIVKTQIDRPADTSVADTSAVLVLSAMGDTTDFLLEAGDNAITRGGIAVEESILKINELHLDAVQGLGVSKSVPAELSTLLAELAGLLAGISLIKEISPRTRDYMVSFGERLSVRVAALYFNSIGIKARAVDAWDAGFISDSNFTRAELLAESWDAIPRAIRPLLDAGVLPVVTGFIAKDSEGLITTLGRGGSDLTATMIAAACHAEEVQVWKDVDGILTANPKIVANARLVEEADYEEAAELAYFGAEVLHPRAMQPCMTTGTPVRVKNSYNPASPGTLISNHRRGKDGAGQGKGTFPLIRAITSKKNVTLVDIVSTRMLGQYGFLEGVFAVFAAAKISIDVIATSEVSVSLTIDSSHRLGEVQKKLSAIAAVSIHDKKAIVTVVGDVCQSGEVLQKIFGVCAAERIQVQMISQGASKHNISFIVNDDEAAPIVIALHRKFFET